MIMEYQLDLICVSTLQPMYLQFCTHSADTSLTHFLGVSRLGTGSSTRCCDPRGGEGMLMEQKS